MRTHLPRAAGRARPRRPSLAACGSDDDEPSGSGHHRGPRRRRHRASAPSTPCASTPTTSTAPAGAISLDLRNEGSLAHTLVIEDHEGDLKLTVAGGGDPDDGTITLEAGEYAFYCDVAGHRAGGMEGTLTVEEVRTRNGPGDAPGPVRRSSDRADARRIGREDQLPADDADHGQVDEAVDDRLLVVVEEELVDGVVEPADEARAPTARSRPRRRARSASRPSCRRRPWASSPAPRSRRRGRRRP